MGKACGAAGPRQDRFSFYEGSPRVKSPAAGGRVRLSRAAPDTLDVALEKLRESGARVAAGRDSIEIEMAARPATVSLRTAPYPGYPF